VLPGDPAVIIRPPREGRALMAAWIGFGCLPMVAGAAGQHDRSAAEECIPALNLTFL
jgi:hypothetical protein